MKERDREREGERSRGDRERGTEGRRGALLGSIVVYIDGNSDSSISIRMIGFLCQMSFSLILNERLVGIGRPLNVHRCVSVRESVGIFCIGRPLTLHSACHFAYSACRFGKPSALHSPAMFCTL